MSGFWCERLCTRAIKVTPSLMTMADVRAMYSSQRSEKADRAGSESVARPITTSAACASPAELGARSIISEPYRRAGAEAEPFIEVEPVPVAPGVDELPEFIVPLDCTAVVPIVVSFDPGATMAPVPRAPVVPGGSGVDIPPVVLMLPVLFTGGRTIGAPPAGRSVRLMSGFAGFAGYGVWASTEPASMSAPDETSEMRDLCMMFSFYDGCRAAMREIVEEALADFCAIAHRRFQATSRTEGLARPCTHPDRPRLLDAFTTAAQQADALFGKNMDEPAKLRVHFDAAYHQIVSALRG